MVASRSLFRLMVLGVALAATLLLTTASGPTASVQAQGADACGNEVIDVPDSGPNFNFTEACEIHDDCYGEGGSEADRRACDREFLTNMLGSCAEMWDEEPLRRLRCNTVAYTYFLGVRIGGWAFFDYD